MRDEIGAREGATRDSDRRTPETTNSLASLNRELEMKRMDTCLVRTLAERANLDLGRLLGLDAGALEPFNLAVGADRDLDALVLVHVAEELSDREIKRRAALATRSMSGVRETSQQVDPAQDDGRGRSREGYSRRGRKAC